MSAAAVRSPFFDSALHIVKGAVCAVLRIPTGRTTERVSQSGVSAENVVSGSITLNSIETPLSEEQQQLISVSIENKISEDQEFQIFRVARPLAERVYLETMYDKFPVPAEVQELRMVCLDGWNLNCNRFPILKSTGLISAIKITKVKHNDKKQTLELSFQVFPAVATPDAKDFFAKDPETAILDGSDAAASLLPSLANVVPYVPEEDLAKAGVASDAAGGSQKVTPWEVETSAKGGIDYAKLIRDFGCSAISEKLLQRMQQLTVAGRGAEPGAPVPPLHRFLRRGLFFAHRDLNVLLERYSKQTPFYLYTGRGPSSTTLHVGHLVPFMFTKWLQDAFDVPLVIQLSDDEKFFFKEHLSLEEVRRMAFENAKDIIACGFNPEKTFIFSNLDYMGTLYPTVCKIQKFVTYNQARGIFGFTGTDNCGKSSYPAVQAAPSFPCAFPSIFGERSDIMCLIPQAIDQDPYFRMTRDVAPRLGLMKPALIHSQFFPALQGSQTKMSGSSTNTTILVSDSEEDIRRKITKYCFSGGKDNIEEHRRLGADLSVDVAYQYLCYLMEDDEEVARIGTEYAAGRLLTGEVKDILIRELVKITKQHQEARARVTDETVRMFMDPHRPSLKPKQAD